MYFFEMVNRKKFKYEYQLAFIMDSIGQAVQSFQALGYERLKGIIDYAAFTKTATMEGREINSYGSYQPETGQYKLDLQGANIVKSDHFRNINQRLMEIVESEDFPPQRKLKEIGKDALDKVKRELDLPDSVSIGDIFVNMNDDRFIFEYFPDIVVSGTNLEQLFNTFQPIVEKLGYTI